MTLKFDGWCRKIIGHLFYITSSFLHHLKPLGEFKLEFPCDLAIWWMTLKNNRAPLLCYIKLCASFQCHQWIQTKVTVGKRSIRVKSGDFFVPCDLEIWWMTLKNNRAPLLCYLKLCASFHHHIWNQTGVTVRKLLSWVLTSVTLTFDLDLCMDITSVIGNNSWKFRNDTMMGT